MSAFGDAFKAARASGAKTFDFGGKSYTTQTADEARPSGASGPHNYGRGTPVTQNNLNAANASSDPIAALNSQKQWTGPGSDARDDEAGMTRGTQSGAGAGRGGQGGPTAADVATPQDAEAGMSRGTRSFADAGRGGQGGMSLADIVNGPAKYDAGAGRGAQGTAAEGYANGGPIKGKPMLKHPNIRQDAHTAVPPHAQPAAAAPSALMMPASATGALTGPPPASAQQANPGGGFANGGQIGGKEMRGGVQKPKTPNPSFQPFGTKPGATPA